MKIRNRFGRLTHGHNRIGAQSSTYRSWRAVIQRCCNPTAANYSRFGAKGITCCERWRKFENFLADLGPRPKNKTLGRVFDLMPYGPGTAYFQSAHEQRMRKLAHHFFEGKVKGWSDRQLNAVVKFIFKVLAEVPDTDPRQHADEVLKNLYVPAVLAA
jgi:hypothetical protein